MPQVTLQTKDEKGDDLTQTFHLEEDHAENESQALRSLAERAENASELQSENETLRGVMVGEVVRRKKLSGNLEGEDAVQQEQQFLEGLPAERLKMHYERALEMDVDTGGAIDTSGGSDNQDNPSGPDYDEMGL